MIIVLLTPEMQMLPKYHQWSCVTMKMKKKKEKHLILVLYNKRMIYWYLSSISEEIFVLCVNYRLFPFCYALLSVYFSMMYDDCCLVTSGLTSQTQFRVTNRWLLVEISTPKHVQNLFIGLLDGGQVGRLWKRLVAWIMMTCWFLFKKL